jgi:hypothetical protein
MYPYTVYCVLVDGRLQSVHSTFEDARREAETELESQLTRRGYTSGLTDGAPFYSVRVRFPVSVRISIDPQVVRGPRPEGEV